MGILSTDVLLDEGKLDTGTVTVNRHGTTPDRVRCRAAFEVERKPGWPQRC